MKTSSLSALFLGVDPYGLSLIRQKTTSAPLVYSGVTFTVATNFGPQAARDTSTAPTLGYHYDPLDYVFGGVSASSNLTFSAGTAVGFFYTSSGGTYGLALGDSVRGSFNGTASAPCRWARYSTVQEGGNGNWTAQSWLGGITGQSYSAKAPVIQALFTDGYELAEEGNLIRDDFTLLVVNAQNCEFYSGGAGAYYVSLNMTNCLFENAAPGLYENYGADNLTMQGCTLFRGNVTADNTSGLAWPVTIVNCAFDSTTFYMNAHGGPTNGYYTDYNSFLLNSNTTLFLGGHEVTVTGSYNWETGPWGNFYQPASSPLIDMGGDTAADLGLDTFTTQTNQEPDTGTVDIGYHYPISGYIGAGLVAYWRLNDGSGSVAVDCVGGNNLTLKSTETQLPVWGSNYLTFDGATQYGDAGNPGVLNITGNITICAWVNSTSFPTAGNSQVPVEHGYDGTDEGYFIRYADYIGSTLEAGSYDASGQFGNIVSNLNSAGQWYFLTSTYDGTNWNLYVDGLLPVINRQSALSGALTTTAPLYVGAAYISTSIPVEQRFFNGAIHDVGIYDRALDANEVRVNFLNTQFAPGVALPDLLYYKMTYAETQQTNQYNIVLSDYSISAEHAGYGVADIAHYGQPGRQYWYWYSNNISQTEALHFNGNNTVLTVTNSSTAFNFTTNPFTVNMWAWPYTGGGCLIQNGGTNNGWYIENGGSESIIFGSATPSSSSYISTANGELNTSLMKMLTCVWDGTNATVFVNGSQVPVSGSFCAPASSTSNLTIGVNSAGTDYLDGDIWLPQIWSTNLQAADIANLYIHQVKGNPWP